MVSNKAKEILEKIRSGHVTPESKFRLQWKNYLFWIIWFLMIVFGAISFSLVIFNLLDFGPEMFHYFRLGRIFRLIVFTAPHLWIILSFLALFFGLLAMRKTRRGYRYSILSVTAAAVLAISILGVSMHFMKINERFGMGIGRGTPGFGQIAFPEESRWEMAKEGLLGGEIISLQDEFFDLKDLRGDDWRVDYSDKTDIKTPEPLRAGMVVGVIGEKINNNTFQAKFIKLLPPRRGPHSSEDGPGKARGMFQER
jgi:hypothetical protein